MEISPVLSAQILCLGFLAILFLQSGFDKIFNYKENSEWLTGHFANSPLKKMVGLMMPVITLLELASGTLSAIGIIFLVSYGTVEVGLIAAQVSAASIIALFFGQRLAREYEGAATLTTYFIITIITIFLMAQ